MTGEQGDGKNLIFIPGGVSVRAVLTFAEWAKGEPFSACQTWTNLSGLSQTNDTCPVTSTRMSWD